MPAERLVFVSFSGSIARAVADALYGELGFVFDADVFMSHETIVSGERWHASIEDNLARAHFGIIVCTPDNQSAPWLLFEAGALGRALPPPQGSAQPSGRVCPYLVGMEARELAHPLTAYQARKADEQESRRLFLDIASEFDAREGPTRARMEVAIPRLLEEVSEAERAVARWREQNPAESVTNEERRHRELLVAIEALAKDVTKLSRSPFRGSHATADWAMAGRLAPAGSIDATSSITQRYVDASIQLAQLRDQLRKTSDEDGVTAAMLRQVIHTLEEATKKLRPAFELTMSF
ncbi:MAG: toll/interleukin-1 receptor domain-containing protein [Sandaracinaceae bacterium]